jgi:hypothetical protein
MTDSKNSFASTTRMKMRGVVLKSLRLACAAIVCPFAFPCITQGVQTINVDMDHGATYTGTAAAPDIGTKWNSLSAAGTLSTVLDSQGNTISGVAIAFSSSGTVHIYNDTGAGNPNPPALMSDYTYGATYTLTITGLTPNQA